MQCPPKKDAQLEAFRSHFAWTNCKRIGDTNFKIALVRIPDWIESHMILSEGLNQYKTCLGQLVNPIYQEHDKVSNKRFLVRHQILAVCQSKVSLCLFKCATDEIVLKELISRYASAVCSQQPEMCDTLRAWRGIDNNQIGRSDILPCSISGEIIKLPEHAFLELWTVV